MLRNKVSEYIYWVLGIFYCIVNFIGVGLYHVILIRNIDVSSCDMFFKVWHNEQLMNEYGFSL